MKQPYLDVSSIPLSYMRVLDHENPVLRIFSVTVPAELVSCIYTQALIGQQQQAQPYGLHKTAAPLQYIEETYEAYITEQVHEFLLKFFVIGTLHSEIRRQKLLVAGAPRLHDITTNERGEKNYNFVATLFPEIDIQEWKYFAFKAPRRKRYKDLDKQVELFIADEDSKQETYTNETIAIHDWVNFDLTLATSDNTPLIDGYSINLWIKIGNEESDDIFQELFINRTIGETLYTRNEGLREFFNEHTGSNFNFCVTIKDIVPSAFVVTDHLKKQFRVKTNRELHQKLIEAFSFRNDISQRKAMVEEACTLLLSKHPFHVPHFLVLRQQEILLETIQANPDYLVYKAEKSFQRTFEQLAERQVKESILIDQIAFDERLDASHDDIRYYLNLTKRQRMREYIHFKLPCTKIRGQEAPIITQELTQSCLREKTLNYLISYLTKK